MVLIIYSEKWAFHPSVEQWSSSTWLGIWNKEWILNSFDPIDETSTRNSKILQLYFFYYRTKPNSMFGHFVPKTAQNQTLTPLLVTRTASKTIFCKNNSKLCSKMDLHQLWERSDQVLNLVLFDSKKNIAVRAHCFFYW